MEELALVNRCAYYFSDFSGPVYTVPDSLVTTSSFAAQEQRLTTKVYSFDNFRMFLLVTTIINV
jgi:hypothetical protein